MTAHVDKEERFALQNRPSGRAIGYQRWTNLLFIHWRLPAEVLRPLVPEALALDTWQGDAFLGLVAFHMSGVRPWWSPAIPGVSTFHETNLRTYVHLDGTGPGILFFSLEAASSLAVRVARSRWNLPYFRAAMKLNRQGPIVAYSSRRKWPAPAGAYADLRAEIGDPLFGSEQDFRRQPPSTRKLAESQSSDIAQKPCPAPPGTLEFFLAERYLLYAPSPRRGILQGRVHHRPYRLRSARLLKCNETLSAAAQIHHNQPPCHAMFCDGVQVAVYPLKPAIGKSRSRPRPSTANRNASGSDACATS